MHRASLILFLFGQTKFGWCDVLLQVSTSWPMTTRPTSWRLLMARWQHKRYTTERSCLSLLTFWVLTCSESLSVEWEPLARSPPWTAVWFEAVLTCAFCGGDVLFTKLRTLGCLATLRLLCTSSACAGHCCKANVKASVPWHWNSWNSRETEQSRSVSQSVHCCMGAAVKEQFEVWWKQWWRLGLSVQCLCLCTFASFPSPPGCGYCLAPPRSPRTRSSRPAASSCVWSALWHPSILNVPCPRSINDIYRRRISQRTGWYNERRPCLERHRERERERVTIDGGDPGDAGGFNLTRRSMSILGDGVPDSVVAARGAGIRVVMITGDYLLTAIAIAKNVTSSWPWRDGPSNAFQP